MAKQLPLEYEQRVRQFFMDNPRATQSQAMKLFGGSWPRIRAIQEEVLEAIYPSTPLPSTLSQDASAEFMKAMMSVELVFRREADRIRVGLEQQGQQRISTSERRYDELVEIHSDLQRELERKETDLGLVKTAFENAQAALKDTEKQLISVSSRLKDREAEISRLSATVERLTSGLLALRA